MSKSNKNLTSDGKFACDQCNGEKFLVKPDPKSAIKYLRNGLRCDYCNNTGYLVNALKNRLTYMTLENKRLVEELKSYLKSNAFCKTCKSDEMSIPGSLTCEECGLKGNRPWGG